MAWQLSAVIDASELCPSVTERVQSLGVTSIDLPYECAQKNELTEGAGSYARPMPEIWLVRQPAEIAKRVARANVEVSTTLIPEYSPRDL